MYICYTQAIDYILFGVNIPALIFVYIQHKWHNAYSM